MADQTFTSGQILTAAQMSSLQSNIGLTYVTTSAITGTTFNLDGIFTSSYSNYVVTIDDFKSAGNQIYMKLRSGGTPTSTGYYSAQNYTDWTGAASTQGLVNNGAQWNTNFTGTIANSIFMNIFNPQAAKITTMTIQATWNALAAGSGGGYQSATTQFDGISLISASAMTGNITIYGYRK